MKTYSIYHRREPTDFLEYMDALIYVESLVYVVDKSLEDPTKKSILANGISITDEEFEEFIKNSKAFASMVYFLKDNNFYDDKIKNDIKNLLHYWKMEKFLCDESNWKIGGQISEDLLQKAMLFRSGDYRILNRMVHKIRNEEYHEPHFKFLECHELFVEILDDLLDYKEDALKKTFNIYIMYEKLFGTKARFMLMKYISNKEKEYNRLKYECLDDDLAKKQDQKMKERLEMVVNYLPVEFRGYFKNSRWYRV
jgi:hypothetical protein